MLKPIKRVNMRNALIFALAREGVEVTPDKMDNALVWLSEGDKRPDELPESIRFGGITLAWPRGRETRVPTANERAAFNKALKRLHTSEDSSEQLTDEDNVRVYREVYATLVNRLKIDADMALPTLTQRELTASQHLVAAEREQLAAKAPVIEHAVPEGVNLSVLDELLADLTALNNSLNK